MVSSIACGSGAPCSGSGSRSSARSASSSTGSSGRARRNPSQAVASSCARRPSAIASAPARPSGERSEDMRATLLPARRAPHNDLVDPCSHAAHRCASLHPAQRCCAMPLDALDQQIVSLLIADGRRTLADIGREVGLSTPAVKRRVDQLEASGTIRGYTAIVDQTALGWGLEAIIELRLEGNSPPHEAAQSLQVDPRDHLRLHRRRRLRPHHPHPRPRHTPPPGHHQPPPPPPRGPLHPHHRDHGSRHRPAPDGALTAPGGVEGAKFSPAPPSANVIGELLVR